jgi:hypothetical protein
LWRAFRDPQERREDEELSRPIVASGSSFPGVQEPMAAYGHRSILAALRYWWCRRDYAAMVALGDRLDPALLDEDPLVYVYLEAARAHLAKPSIPQPPFIRRLRRFAQILSEGDVSRAMSCRMCPGVPR